MKKQTLRVYAIAASTVLLIVAGASVCLQKTVAQGNGTGPADQLVQLGGTATFSVNSADEASYQWLLGGSAINGQTNSTLTIENVQISDAGFYSCNTATDGNAVRSATASLMVYTVNPDFNVVVYAAPIVSSGTNGTCPGAYTGYVSYTLTVAQGWGWVPLTNTTIYTAADTTRTNTNVQYGGAYGDSGCNRTTVTIPYPAFSPAYRFAIYFTNNVPSTNYPITLTGFNP
jgi:hypothetical protein